MEKSKTISRIFIIALLSLEGCFSPKEEYEIKIVLEIQYVDILRDLSNFRRDTVFNKAIAIARERQPTSQKSFVELFGEVYNEIDTNGHLASVFTNTKLRDRINYNSTNKDVLRVINDEIFNAINNSYNIIIQRIDNFGIPKRKRELEIIDNRIFISLRSKTDDTKRFINLFTTKGNLEFWETYENTDPEIINALIALNNYLRKTNSQTSGLADQETVSQEIITEQEDEISSLLQQLKSDTGGTTSDKSLLQTDSYARENPLFSLLIPNTNQSGELIPGSVFGRVHYKDTAQVNQYLNISMGNNLFPRDFKYFWSAKPIQDPQSKKPTEFYEIHGIKITSRDGKPPLIGNVITHANMQFDKATSNAEVSMSMDATGSTIWARITRDNIGRCIAIVMDDYVYSSPRVNEEIPSGKSQISGNFDANEAADLANILNSAGSGVLRKLNLVNVEITKSL